MAAVVRCGSARTINGEVLCRCCCCVGCRLVVWGVLEGRWLSGACSGHACVPKVDGCLLWGGVSGDDGKGHCGEIVERGCVDRFIRGGGDVIDFEGGQGPGLLCEVSMRHHWE